MNSQPNTPTWGQQTESELAMTRGGTSYSLLSDDQLIVERDRLRERLDQLTTIPGSCQVDCQVLVNMEREVEHMMDELLQRARSRHPSSGGLSSRPRLRSVPSSQHTD
jgi:hypothetical protein